MAKQTPRKPLQDRLEDIERRLTALEGQSTTSHGAVVTPLVTESARTSHPASSPEPPRLAAPVLLDSTAPADRPRTIDVEGWFRWAGIGLVVLATAFLLSVAIQRGWLTPTVRVMGGLGIGVALYAVGLLARSRSDAYATALGAGGAAVTYGMLWAGFQAYGLFSFTVAGLGMLVVVTVLFLEVFRHDDSNLAVLATLAGFATPFLLTAVGREPGGPGAETAPLLAYVGFFVVLTAAVHYFVGWRTLRVVAAGAAVISLGIAAAAGDAGAGRHPEAGLLTTGLGLIALAYWLVPTVIHERVESARRAHPPVSGVARSIDDALVNLVRLSGFILLPVALVGTMAAWDLDSVEGGIVAFGLALVAGGVAVAVRHETNGYINGLLASLLATIGLSLVLDGEVRMIALAAQAAVLVLIADRVQPPTPFRVQAHVLAGIAGLMVLTRLLDGYLVDDWAVPLSSLAVIGIIGFGAWVQEGRARAVYALGSHVGVLVLVLHLLGASEVGKAFATGTWAVIGLGMVIWGRNRKLRPLELTGLGTLGAVMIRLLGHLADIDPLIRVFLFLAVGVLFLAGGWYVRGGTRPPTARLDDQENEAGTPIRLPSED